MSMSTSEEAARALFDRHTAENPDLWGTWETAHEDDRQHFMNQARVALGVVKERLERQAKVYESGATTMAAEGTPGWTVLAAVAQDIRLILDADQGVIR